MDPAGEAKRRFPHFIFASGRWADGLISRAYRAWM